MAEGRKASRSLLLKPYVPVGRAGEAAKVLRSPRLPAPLEISPERIVFRDVLVRQTYSLTLVIRNLTNESRKIRLFHSLSQNFLVQYDQRVTSLAAGLSLTITVVFDAKLEDMQEFTHELRIVSEDFEKVVEILALRPQMEVECSNLLNFGKVEVGSRTIRELPITNKSKSKVTVTLQADDWAMLRVTPHRLTIKENQTSTVIIEYLPEVIGMLNCRLHLEIEESTRNSKTVQLIGAAFICSCFFTDLNGQRVERISFSSYYIGQKLNQSYKFVNNTSSRLTARFSSAAYALQNNKDRSSVYPANILSPQKYAKYQYERFLVCHPTQADMYPFSEITLNLVAFQRPTAEQLRSFQLRAEGKHHSSNDLLCTDKCTFLVELLLNGKAFDNLRYPVVSDAILPSLTVSEWCLNFGDKVQLKQSSIVSFYIRNCELLPLNITFELYYGTHFAVKGGSNHKLPAKQTKQFEVCYAPKSVGIHAEYVKLKILDFYELKLRTFAETKRTSSLHTTMRYSFSYLPKENNVMLRTDTKKRFKNFSSYAPARRTLMPLANRRHQYEIQSSDEPVDVEFQAGILVSPREQKVKLPNLTEHLYQDNTFKYKQLNRLHPRVNPCSARNKQEQMDIERSLTVEELKAVVVGNTHLNFGVMFVGTVGKDTFMLRNNTSASLQITLIAGESRIEVMQPNQQVIQPGHCGSFELNLSSKQPGSYKSTAKYIINGKHTFYLLLTANFIPVGLEPSVRHLHISIDERDTSFSKSQSLQLRNNGNRPVSFSFSNLPKFEAVPREGEVQPQSSMDINVVYTPVCLDTDPLSNVVDEYRLTCTVEDGPYTYINCMGTVKYAKCSIKQPEVNFGELPVSMVIKSKLTVKNHSRLATVFKIELQPYTLEYYLSFKNEVLNIKPYAKQEVYFKFCCPVDRVVRGYIILHFRGYKKVSVPFYAKSTVPKLVIREETLDFGEVANGSTAIFTFHLRNDSDVNGLVELPLRSTELGAIGLSTNQKNRGYLKTTRAVVALSEREDCSVSSSRNSDNQKNYEESDSDKEVEPTYHITVPPRYEIPVKLSLQTTKPGELYCQLPIFLVGQNYTLEGINRKIKMKVVPACIHVSLQTIDFRRCVVSEGSDERSVTIEVVNLTMRNIVWKIENSQPRKYFSLTPCYGAISERGTTKLTATFRPEEADEFETIYNFKVTESDGGGNTSIQLLGLGVLPTLLFDRREIILTPVPLNIYSRLTIFILNDGYENVRIYQWKLEDELESVELAFEFMEGRTLSVIKQRLGLQVSFRSREPISFTTTLHVFDSNNVRCSIPISATADNSILTNYPYLETCEGEYNLSDGSSVQLKEVEADPPTKKKFSLNYNSPTLRRDLQFNFFKLPPLHVTKRTCSHVVRWLRYFVSDKVYNFPYSCIRTNGQPIYDMLCKLTGEAYIESNSVSDKVTYRSKTLEPQYANLLRRLKEYGCLLNHIRPYYLLSLDEYLTHTHNIDGRYSLTPAQIQLYEQVSAESWCVLFFQIFKVFVLTKNAVKSFKPILYAFPTEIVALSERTKDSNVLSHQYSRILNFFKPFSNHSLQLFEVSKSRMFANVLERIGCEEVTARLPPFSVCSIRTSLEDVLSENLCSMLTDYGIGLYLNQYDIVTLSHKEAIVYLSHLAQQLEHLVPRQTIMFSCSLGDRPQKNVELKNPTDYEITYWPKLIGSSDFEVQEDLPIRLAPKYSIDYSVRYVCRFNKPSSARLFFVEKTSYNEPETRANPFALSLESEVVGKNAIRYVDFETTQYELFSVMIDVQCPFPLSNRTPIYLSVTLLEDNKKKPSCFFLMTSKVKLIKNKEVKVELKFLSFQAYKRSCRLSFFGEVKGEFIYEVRATVLEPRPMASIPIKHFEVKSPYDVVIQIPTSNEPYERAVKCYIEYWKCRPKLSYLCSPPTSLKCSLLDPYEHITVPDELPCDLNLVSSTLSFPMRLEFKRAYKSYTFRVLFRFTASDIRVVQFTTRVRPKPLTIKLSMYTSARTEVIQSLPIYLFPSTATLHCENTYLFLLTQLREFDVDCQIDKLIVAFKPNWVCSFTAKLAIEQTDTLEQIIYEITARGTEPSPYDVIEVTMQNRNRYTKLLEVKCSTTDSMAVESTLPFCHARCTNSSQQQNRMVSMRNFSFGTRTHTYEVELLPDTVGSFEGVLKFVSGLTQQYLWYKLKVQVLYNQSSGVIEVVAFAGTIKYISVPKFVDQIGAKFSVVIDAPCIVGDPTFDVIDENSTYTISFYPMKEFKHTGKISFFDIQRNVEVWYTLKVIAERPKPVLHPQIRIGCTLSRIVELTVDNPLCEPITYRILNSNRYFFTVDEAITVEPKSSAVFNVVCSSSTVNSVSEAMLTLTSEHMFTKEFRLSTITIPQETPYLIDFKSELGASSKETLVFHSPTEEYCILSFEFVEDNNGFELLTKDGYSSKPRTTTMSREATVFSLRFSPKERIVYSNYLIITVNGQFRWHYKLSGRVVETLKKLPNLNFSTKCRTPLTRVVEFVLASNDRVETIYVSKDYASIFQFRIILQYQEKLGLQITFSPFKPLERTSVWATMANSSGAIWRFDLLVEALPPYPDDTLLIESNINQCEKVCFRLTNKAKHTAPFTAYITQSSTIEFKVYPRVGILYPYGRQGTPFYISFLPTLYQTRYNGCLIVETDDMYWSFKLVGRLPKYRPPTTATGRLLASTK